MSELLVLGITYFMSAMLQLLAGFSMKVAFESRHGGDDSDPEELVSTARDFESRAPEIPSNKRGAYMPSDEALLAVYSRRYEISLSPLVFLLPTAPLLAAGFITFVPAAVLILLLTIAAGAILLVFIRKVRTPEVFGLGIITFSSICLHLLLGVIFLVLGIVNTPTPVDSDGVAIGMLIAAV